MFCYYGNRSIYTVPPPTSRQTAHHKASEPNLSVHILSQTEMFYFHGEMSSLRVQIKPSSLIQLTQKYS